jgi:predicted transposase YdaD
MLGVDITLQETRFYKEVKAEGKKEGKKEGKEEERRSLVSILLDRKLGKLPQKTKKTIAALDLAKLESLAIALLDFETIDELDAWLKQK